MITSKLDTVEVDVMDIWNCPSSFTGSTKRVTCALSPSGESSSPPLQIICERKPEQKMNVAIVLQESRQAVLYIACAVLVTLYLI